MISTDVFNRPKSAFINNHVHVKQTSVCRHFIENIFVSICKLSPVLWWTVLMDHDPIYHQQWNADVYCWLFICTKNIRKRSFPLIKWWHCIMVNKCMLSRITYYLKNKKNLIVITNTKIHVNTFFRDKNPIRLCEHTIDGYLSEKISQLCYKPVFFLIQ